jgi:dephospho-CoA kinase
LDPKGRVDRKKLGQSVFGDVRRRNKLNQLLHPEIRKRVAAWVDQKGRSKPTPLLVVVEVPLLFERGFYRFFDKNLSVSAPRKLRHWRLKKRGWAPQEILRREHSQWSQGRKDRMADWVIRNDKGLEKLKESVSQWLCHAREGISGTSRGSNSSRKVY